MIIYKPSFIDYLYERDEHLLADMAIPPTQFKNPDTGQLEGDYHVQSRTPIFTDKYDILYLYQFPPRYWSAAMAARYNEFLYEAKMQGDKFNDIQDVPLKIQGGASVIFRKRNTFAHHLVDKIQRAVDVDFFRKHGKNKSDFEKYQKESEGHRAAGRDLGGYIGASLEDMKEKDVVARKDYKKGKEFIEKTWASKGFLPPSRVRITYQLEDWKQGSSEGWLKSLDGLHLVDGSYKSGGGGRPAKNADRNAPKVAKTYKSFAGHSLRQIQHEMAQNRAVPFRVIDESRGLVSWPDVAKKSKSGKISDIDNSYVGDENARDVGEPLPILFPGANIHSDDLNAYEDLKSVHDKFKNINQEDLKKIQEDLNDQIKMLQHDIDQKDVNDQWHKDVDGNSPERAEASRQLAYLKNLQGLKDWTRQQFPGLPLNAKTIQDALPKYLDQMKNEMKSLQNSARKYKAYHWNVHEYNRTRKPHDPLGVGMGNPLVLGQPEHESLTDKSRGFGTLWPNRNSKHLVHGEPGTWENEFQPYFGLGKENEGKFQNKSTLTDADRQEIVSQTNDYVKKIAEKLANNPEVSNYLDLSPGDKLELTSSKGIKKLVIQAHPELKKFDASARSSMPSLLTKAYVELENTEKSLENLNQEVDTGSTLMSPVYEGVKKYIESPMLAQHSIPVQTALHAVMGLVARSAENYVRRTVGHSAWKNYLDTKKSGAKGIAKHQQILDVNQYASKIAFMYANSISQLDIDGIGTRRLRNKNKSNNIAGVEDQGYGANLAGDASQSRLDLRTSNDVKKGATKFGKTDYLTGMSRDKGTTGRSVEMFYELIDELENKTGEKASQQEIDMINGISTAYALFFLRKNEYMQKMQQAGTPVSDKEANNVARKQVIDEFKSQGLVPATYGQATQQGDQPAIAASGMSSFLPDVDDKMDQEKARQIRADAVKAGLTPSMAQPPEPEAIKKSAIPAVQNVQPRPTAPMTKSPLLNRLRNRDQQQPPQQG